jgi:chemosensory pili system protein ChpA (sensor histidine kinase/response regulator)
LLVEAADQIFAMPSHNIEQVTAAGLGEIDVDSSGAFVYRYRDVSYSLRELGALTGYPVSAATAADFALLPKVLILVDGLAYAVAVTRVVDSRELIVKNMGHYLQLIHGISGATLMGDGTVVPMLNIKDLVIDPLAMTEAIAKMAAEARRQAIRIVVVDDSVSVRKSLIQLFEDAGYDVRSASDGLDAIRVIAEFHPHAVCTDMEMPNMNGLELTQHLRQKPETKLLPIMMITSRSMDKHRQQATRAGVDAYVTKPYVDMVLRRQMRDLIESVTTTASSALNVA